jgi:hypothetical protein
MAVDTEQKYLFRNSCECPQVLAVLLASHFFLIHPTSLMPFSSSYMNTNSTCTNSRYKHSYLMVIVVQLRAQTGANINVLNYGSRDYLSCLTCLRLSDTWGKHDSVVHCKRLYNSISRLVCVFVYTIYTLPAKVKLRP